MDRVPATALRGRPGEHGLVTDDGIVRVLSALSTPFGITLLLMSSAVLLGWALDIPALKSVLPGLATMKANTAFGFVLASSALLAARSSPRGKPALVGPVCAVLAVLLACITLFEYAADVSVGIDELVFRDTARAGQSYAGRMSPLTALCFVACGLALLFAASGRRIWASHYCALAAATLAGLALVGYLYSVQGLYRLSSYSEMAVHTALGFELLSFGILVLRPGSGMTGVFASAGAGGATARRLLPAVVATPVLLGWLRLQGQRVGLYNTEMGLAIVVTAMIAVLSWFVWRNARSLLHLEEARRQADSLQRRTEAALQLSEERYRRLFEEDLAGAFIGRPDGTILDCNPAFLRIFGFSSVQHATGTNASSLYPSEELRKSLLARLRRERTIEALDVELRRVDGSPVSVITNVVGTFDDSGELVEVKGYLLDNSARRKAEEHLRQAQRIDAIGRLAGGIAHDFNNLLGVITGYNELLLRMLPAGGSAFRYASEVGKSAERAAALTHQLLAFSRKQILQPRVLDMNTVVLDMERLLQRLIGEDIQLVTKRDPGLRRINADPGQIEQVIMNLAVNARDAMPQGGKLTIETANVFLDEAHVSRHLGAREGHHVMLAVSDTGQGMDAATRARMFEPFFTTKEQGKGTGLGLATVYGIVKQSEGSIWVYSEPGQGTTLKVYLPAVEDTGAVETDAPIGIGVARGSETVLVVEDEDMLREIVKEALQASGYAVLEARHGAEALRICDEHASPIDLIITDTVMPGIGGRELAERILSSRPDSRILYMSGYTDDTIVRHGVLTADVQFLQKPFSLEALSRKVRSVLDAKLLDGSRTVS